MSSEDSDISSLCEDDCNEEMKCDYEGFKPRAGVTELTDVVSADISPREFFRQYIRPRRPVVINGLLNDQQVKFSDWSNSYLKSKAGSAKVLVEDRRNPDGTDDMLVYGKAPKKEMSYGDLLSAISRNDIHYYMTTQNLDNVDADGIPRTVYGEPLKSLTGDFVVRPSLLGNLVPHQITLWQGIAGKSFRTSSGLHHDFHDNLYVVVRGSKRFRLFPPSAAPHLRVVGKIRTIYKNGLVVYRSQNVRADGAPLAAVARRAKEDAEKDLEQHEGHLAELEASGADEHEINKCKELIKICEDKLEDGLDALLR